MWEAGGKGSIVSIFKMVKRNVMTDVRMLASSLRISDLSLVYIRILCW